MFRNGGCSSAFHNIKQAVLAENDAAMSCSRGLFPSVLWDLQAAFQFIYSELTLTVEQNAESFGSAKYSASRRCNDKHTAVS